MTRSGFPRSKRHHGFLLGSGVALLAAGVACSVYDTSLVESSAGSSGKGGANQAGSAGQNNGATGGLGGNAGASGSSNTGGLGGSAGSNISTEKFWNDREVGGECPTEGRPSKAMRPEASDGGEVEPIYVAMKRLRFGSLKDLTSLENDPEAWRDIGFNLDLACNRATWPAGALSGAAAQSCPAAKFEACTNDIQNVFDGNYCKDNAIGKLFVIAAMSPIIGDPFRLNEPDWNCALHRGSMSVIFKVSQYNGEPNDHSVRLDMYSSTGVESPAAWNCRADESKASQLSPDWQAQAAQPLNNRWRFSERDIDPAAPDPGPNQIKQSKWADASAYVRDGWLVAELPPNTELWFNGQNAHTKGLRLSVQNTILAAKLVQDPQSELWSFSEASMGGSIKPGDMITSFREMGFCENTCSSYTTTIAYMNSSVDILSTSNDPVPEAACDAMSFGIDFTAGQIYPGAVVSVPNPPDVTSGKCGEPPAHEDIGRPGCECPTSGSGPCTTPGGIGGAGGAGGGAGSGGAAGSAGTGGAGG